MELKLEQSLPEHTYKLKARTLFSTVHKYTTSDGRGHHPHATAHGVVL